MRSLVLLVPLAALCSNSRPHNVEFAGERPIRVSLKRIKKTDREITRGQLGHFSLITPRYTRPGAVREGNAVTASYVPREFPVRKFGNHAPLSKHPCSRQIDTGVYRDATQRNTARQGGPQDHPP